MNNSLTYGTPVRMLPDGHDRCHGEGCGKLLHEDKLTYIDDQPFCAACCVCAGCGETATAMQPGTGDLLCRSCLDTQPSCPECGVNDFAVREYDFGMSSETGYHDAGERGICRACGCNADIADFAPRKVPALMCTACESSDHGTIGAELAHHSMRCSCACHGKKV